VNTHFKVTKTEYEFQLVTSVCYYVLQVQLLQQHYTWARVTSRSDVIRVQMSDMLSSNKSNKNNFIENEAKTQLKPTAHVDAV